MTLLTSTEYYLHREREELLRAQVALDQSIATIHLEMAARYARLASETRTVPGRPRAVAPDYRPTA